MEKQVKDILYNMSLNQYKRGIGKIHKGHSIFKFNIDTEEVSRIEGEYKYEFGYIYMPALNLTNASRKFYIVCRYAVKQSKYPAANPHVSLIQAGLEQDKVNT